jgi:hypothetical protein
MAEREEDEVRRILTPTDITRLVERLLHTLCEMERRRNVRSFILNDVYQEMDFHGYNLELAIPVILEDNIIPQQLAQVNEDNITLTEKGRQRCQQIQQRNEWEWHDTLERLNRRVQPS